MSPLLPGCVSKEPIEACRPLLVEAMQDVRVPDRFSRAAAAMLDTDTLRFVEDVCDDLFVRGRLLLLCGQPDGGKTFACYALGCLGYLRHGVSFESHQASDLMQMAWDDKHKADYNDAWAFHGLLILDEFDKMGTTEGLGRALYAGMNHRYANCLPTALTANMGMADLTARYPDFAAALNSRFAEWAVCRTFVRPQRLRQGQSVEPAVIGPEGEGAVILDGETVSLDQLQADGREWKANL